MLNDAKKICLGAIENCISSDNIKNYIRSLGIDKQVYMLAVGKAAFSMAKAASEVLSIKKGIVISKYGHITGSLENVDMYEAGHPILDENTITATEKTVELFSNLNKDDIVVFLLSGGASALFELPEIKLDELREINDQMLKKGMNISEINTIRKKLSIVKGGKFAQLCKPAKIYSVIISDVLSDQIDMIGSGPTASDSTTAKDALDIISRYELNVSDRVLDLISSSESVIVDNCDNHIVASVKILFKKACEIASQLGYRVVKLKDDVDINCRVAADYLYDEMMKHIDDPGQTALIMTGETTVIVKGEGLGGRNQELVFSQIKKLSGMNNVIMMSLGSDGTDGPTDAAGAYADAGSYSKLIENDIDFDQILEDNDTYHALKKIEGLIFTGPTGTNVNDISLVLINNN